MLGAVLPRAHLACEKVGANKFEGLDCLDFLAGSEYASRRVPERYATSAGPEL